MSARSCSRLGSVTSEAIDQAGRDASARLSAEDLSLFDTNLLLWIDDEGMLSLIQGLTLCRSLEAHTEGRVNDGAFQTSWAEQWQAR